MKKYHFMVLRLSVLVMLLFLFVSTVKAQTFVCTDVSFYDSNIPREEREAMRADALGGLGILTFYDKSVKMTFIPCSNDKVAIVLDKKNNSTYTLEEVRKNGYEHYNAKRVVELQKWETEVKSFAFSYYTNGYLNYRLIFKRK